MLLTRKQAAERLGLSVKMVRRLNRDGDLPVISFGYRTKRVREDDVRRLAQKKAYEIQVL